MYEEAPQKLLLFKVLNTDLTFWQLQSPDEDQLTKLAEDLTGEPINLRPLAALSL